MKRLVALLLALAMIIAMSACGNDNAGTQSAGASSGQSTTAAPDAGKAGGKTIELWQDNIDKITVGIMNDAAAQYEKDTGVKVNFVFTEAAPYKTKLKTAMGSGQAPDIFLSWGGGWLRQFINEDQVYEVTDSVKDWKDGIVSAAWNDATYDGKIYGMPYNLNGTALYYNKAMFDRLGLTAPKTWEDLEKVAATLKENKIIPFALGNINKWPGCMYFIYLSMRFGGPELFTNAEQNIGAAFQDESYIKAGQMIQKMVDDGWFPQGMNGINYDTGGDRMLFYTEKAGMMLQNTNFAPKAQAEAIDFYDSKLAISTFPTIDSGKGNDGVLCGSNYYSVSNNCKNKDEAVAFIKYYLTDPDIVNRRANEGGNMVTLSSVKYEKEKTQLSMDQLIKASFMQNSYDQALDTQLGELHKDTTQALFGKTMTPEEAAKQMQAKADEIIPKK